MDGGWIVYGLWRVIESIEAIEVEITIAIESSWRWDLYVVLLRLIQSHIEGTTN